MGLGTLQLEVSPAMWCGRPARCRGSVPLPRPIGQAGSEMNKDSETKTGERGQTLS
jgi:hypothetical protein